MKIVDTHQHLWDMNLFSYSWCENIPPLNRSFRMDDYLEATGDLEIYKTIHLEADVDEEYMLDESAYILKLAADKSNPLAGFVAPARPERDDFGAYLERLGAHPQLKGVRRVLHTQADELILHPTFVRHLKTLAAHDLSFDLCVLARQLPLAIKLIEQCPDVSFILDHCGNPPIKEKSIHPWRGHISRIAALPNVVCKISGLVTNADERNPTHEDLRPYVEHVIDAFGWDRVMFGSDWPVCTLAATFRAWVDALSYLTKDAGESERDKLFCRNALRVYRLQ